MCLRLLVLFPIFITVLNLSAQVKKNDFTEGSKEFQAQENIKERKMIDDKLHEKDVKERKIYKNDNKTTQPTPGLFQDKSSDRKMNKAFGTNQFMYENKKVEFPKKQYDMFSGNKKMSTMPNIATLKEIVLYSKYKDASKYGVPHKEISEEMVQEMVDKISMKDINRYQFRHNRSNDPGLPVQQAGSKWFESAKTLLKKE
jgi:alkylated DNA repair dioxygenase AlkB